MIEILIKKLIEELGATGVLVIGLYFILFKPLNSMSRHVKVINEELGNICKLLRDSIKKSWRN